MLVRQPLVLLGTEGSSVEGAKELIFGCMCFTASRDRAHSIRLSLLCLFQRTAKDNLMHSNLGYEDPKIAAAFASSPSMLLTL